MPMKMGWRWYSRHTEVRREDIEKVPGLDIIAESPESGVSIVMARNGRDRKSVV